MGGAEGEWVKSPPRFAARLVLAGALAACSPREERAQQVPPEGTPAFQQAAPAPDHPGRRIAARRKAEPTDKPKRLRELERAYVVLDDAEARSATIDKIAELEIPGIAEALGRLFAIETDPELKEAILSEIGWSDDPDPVRAAALAQGLQPDQPATVRRAAVDEFMELEPATALPLLRPLLNDPDESVRAGAKDAIYVLENP
jgi:HEAT repeat protein